VKRCALALMKQIVVVVLLLVSTSAQAEWTRVEENDTFIAYANLGTIRKAGNRAKIWQLFDFKTRRRLSTGQAYLSKQAHWEFDCDGERQRALYYSSHSGNMARGVVIDYDAYPSTWAPIASGSLSEILWKVACNQ
jgi:hypothetical protein